MTVIKSSLIPKFVYVSSLLPNPKELVKDLNRLLFKFLWKGTDKVTWASPISDFEHIGLKMIDLPVDSMIVSLRLAWLKRIFSENSGTWKSYQCHLLEHFNGLFFITCNYYLKDYPKSSQFYYELLSWWTHFPNTFDSECNWCHIFWNNKEIHIEINLFTIQWNPNFSNPRFLEPNLVSLGFTSLELYNFTPDFSKLPITQTILFSPGTNWPSITWTCENFETT